jgi:hypothetical protein
MSASYVSFRRSENKLKQARLQVAMGRIGFANNGPNLHHPFLCESAQTDTRNRPPYQMPRGLRVTRHGTGKFCFSKKKSLENARPRCDSRARRAVTRALGQPPEACVQYTCGVHANSENNSVREKEPNRLLFRPRRPSYPHRLNFQRKSRASPLSRFRSS